MRIALFNYPLATLGGGARHTIAIARALARRHAVTLFCEPGFGADSLAQRLGMPLAGITLQALPVGADVARSNAAVSEATRAFDVFLNCSYRFVRPQAPRAVQFVFFPNAVDMRAAARLRWLAGKALVRARVRLPAALRSRAQGLPTRADLAAFSRYRHFWCNSRYTQAWLRAIWHRESTVVYPLVAPIAAQPARDKTIINVGRFFFHNGASKKQEVLIGAFRRMCDAGLVGWRLQLVGGLNPNIGRSVEYLDGLRAQSAGYPIEIMVDAPWPVLQQALGRAAIYWHAMGFGEDLALHPDRAEHFGITTVEAMSAGCVPVVFDAGGQKEIVDEGRTGHLWRTEQELITHTTRLIDDAAERSRMAGAARARSAEYCDEEAFSAHCLAALDRVMAASAA